MRVLLLCLILAGAALLPQAAAQTARVVDEEAKAEALRAYQKGMAHYNLNEFDEAIAQFEAGYRAVPQAVFLYNIAQAHRMASRPQKAIEFYRKYLRQDPGAKNFREVQERIEALEKLIADSSKPPAEPSPAAPGAGGPGAPAPAKDAPAQPGPAAEAPQPATPEPPPAAAPEAPAPAPFAVRAAAPPPRRKVWPIVLGVLGGAAVVGVAVGLGVSLGTASEPRLPIWQSVTP